MKDYQYPRISDEDYSKKLLQLMLRLGVCFNSIASMYGQREEIDGKLKCEVKPLIEQWGMAIRGKNVPVIFPPEIERKYDREQRYLADD